MVGEHGGAPARWRLPRDLFQFTTTERAELHTVIVQVFADAHERLHTALSFDDVRTGLQASGWLAGTDDEALARALQSLVGWGLLDVTQDHAHAYATAEEYERKNLRYGLTRAGEAAIAGVEHALDHLEATGALQTAVLDAIADRLAELARLVPDPTADDRRVYAALTELELHLESLRTSTKRFNAELQRLLRDDVADGFTFDEVKAATVTYLEEYVTDLDVRADAIAEGIARVEAAGVATLHRRALDGADLPAFGGVDPAPRWLAQRAARWQGLQEWFRPADGAVPRVQDLRAVAQRAIVSLLRVLERLRDARRRSSSTAEDFRALARWFASGATEADAHRLHGAAFGLWSARHAHLVADDPERAPTSTPWDEAPPVPVAASLRSRGRAEHVARTGAVRDTADLGRARRARAAAERVAVEQAWRDLATDGAVQLSDLGAVDHPRLGRLLELLGQALASPPGPGGRRRAVTADGQLEIALTPPRDGARASLPSLDPDSGECLGTLGAPDYVITITSLVERRPLAVTVVDDEDGADIDAEEASA